MLKVDSLCNFKTFLIIVLLVPLISLISSCAGKSDSANDKVGGTDAKSTASEQGGDSADYQFGYSDEGTNFYGKYYIVKDITDYDISKLKALMEDNSPPVSYKAELILGYYYQKFGNSESAEEILEKYGWTSSSGGNGSNQKSGDAAALPDDYALMAKLWLYDYYVESSKYPEAKTIALQIDKQKQANFYNDTVKIYCVKEGLYTGKDDPLCYLNKQFAKSSSTIAVGSDSPSSSISVLQHFAVVPRVGLGSVSPEIFVHASDASSELVKGVMYKIKEGNLAYSLSTYSGERPNHGIVIQPRERKLFINNEEFRFHTGSAEVAYGALRYITKQSRYKSYIIATNERYIDDINKMLKSFRSVDICSSEYYVLNYEERNFQRALNSIMAEKDGQANAFIGIGDEADMAMFTPYAQYHVDDAERQSLYMIVDMFSGVLLQGDYKDYSINANILTKKPFINKRKYEDLNNGFRRSFGDNINTDNLIGIDMVSFIKWYLTEQGEQESPDVHFNMYGADYAYFTGGMVGFKVLDLATLQKFDTNIPQAKECNVIDYDVEDEEKAASEEN